MTLGKLVLLCLCLGGQAPAKTLVLPRDQRPDWLCRDGVVMAWSMEPLLFRVRRDGGPGYDPTPEQRAAYLREYTAEMIDRLRQLGINLVMIHCYKGAGLTAERQSMDEAVQFAKRLHDAGMRVAVYNYSGAFLWEPFFEELPEAEQWVLLDAGGKKRTYGGAPYRYYWNRNHPDAQAFYRKLVRFAVEEIGADLIHFDNYTRGPGRDEISVRRFREYLKTTFSRRQLSETGVDDPYQVEPAMTGAPDNMLRRAWLDFSCRSLSDSYHQMSQFARSLRKDVLVECNPGGIRTAIAAPVDHGRLLQGGEAFWDESMQVGCDGANLHTRIRTYKVARRMDNIAFTYVSNPLEMAEAMAFNLDCLGALYEFEYGEIHNRRNEFHPEQVAPYVRFFHDRGDLLRGAEVVADVAVLRSFPSQLFADPHHAALSYRAEQSLIENCGCFQIIYDHHLRDLRRYRVLVLAGCIALSDEHARQIEQYVVSGGRLCMIGAAATHDEWMRPRRKPLLNDLPPDRAIRVLKTEDLPDAIHRAFGGQPSVTIRATPKPLENPWRAALGQKLYTDRPYLLVDAPEELLGLATIRFSHNRAKVDSSLYFHANVPLRVYAEFTPEGEPVQWMKRPPEWKLYKKASLKTTMKSFGTVMDIYYLDLPAGDVTLFEGKQGNYVIVALQPRDRDCEGPGFTPLPRGDVPLGLCVELTEKSGQRMLHLVNYRKDGPIEDAKVRLRVPAGHRVRSVTLASPEHADRGVSFRQKTDAVEFVVPHVSVYEIAIVHLEQEARSDLFSPRTPAASG
jgi:hypothetical protein